MDENQEPKPPKRKLWLKREVANWKVTKAQGFFPAKELFSEEELRDFLQLNDDVEPVLSY